MAALSPMIGISIVFLIFVILAGFAPKPRDWAGAFAGLLIMTGTGIPLVMLWAKGAQIPPTLFFEAGPLSVFLSILFVVSALLVCLISGDYFEKKGYQGWEFYALISLSLLGMIIMVQASHLLSLFLGIETMSLSFYTLSAFLKKSRLSVESGLKYFLLGSFSSAFLLFGMGLLYLSTGGLSYREIARSLEMKDLYLNVSLLNTGLVLILLSLAFKMALIPFHFWAPDVYQGAPTPVTAWMAVGGKASVIGVLITLYTRVYSHYDQIQTKWQGLFITLSIITIFAGSMIALTQRHMKRLLAYSSIVHAGFLSLAISALPIISLHHYLLKAILFYVAAYLFMNIGAFSIVSICERKESDESILSYHGMGRGYPAISSIFSLFLFSLAGIPLTSGFLGKFYLFQTLILNHQYIVSVVGLIGAVIATYYYLRVIVALFVDEVEIEATSPAVPPASLIAIGICAFLTLLFGIFPQPLLDFIAPVLP